MKRVDFYYFLTVLLLMLAVGIVSFPSLKIAHGRANHPIYSKDQITQHAVFMMKDGEQQGLCTGTAIGPHALLTAFHCLEETKPDSIRIDLATEDHEILGLKKDGRDHVILLLGGTPFKNIEVVRPVSSRLGDVVVIYGVGGNVYPAVMKLGRVEDCNDPSDMDEAAGEFCNTIHAIPGDSGSAVFNLKGEIVGLTTYSDDDTYPTGSRSFALNFDDQAYAVAAMFEPK